MFDVDNKIGKILGNNQGPMSGQGLGRQRGNGFGQVQRNVNININPQQIVQDIQRLLDKLPEVKKAKGTLTVEFSNGKRSTLHLTYNE